MADINIKIGTTGDISGLNQLSEAHKRAIEKAKQQYTQMRQELEKETIQYASTLERKVMSGQISMGSVSRNFIAGTAGRALRWGSAGAGLLGAYSLFSNIGGELGPMNQRNLSYATALSSTRLRQGLDYSAMKPFFEIRKMFEDLGQTVYMTSKDMEPMLQVAKELGDFSGGRRGTTGGKLAGIVNIGRSLGVDPNVLANMLTEGLQRGNFQQGGQYVEMSKMMMLNQNMMHRATEALNAMSSVLQSTTHGVQGVGAFGVFNLLDTLNSSTNRAYWGSGGAQAAMRLDQAFRQGGGDESFQYMQTMALNPAFQRENARRASMMGGRLRGTNWKSGAYDQLMADLMKELGAFATPEDLIKTMKGMGINGAESYVREMYGSGQGMGKMNIERLLDVYSSSFGAGESSGNKFFMQMQMARSMGVSPVDIGVISQAMSDPEFKRRAREGKINESQITSAFTAWQKGGKEGLDKWFDENTKTQETYMDIAKSIRTTIDSMKETLNQYLPILAEAADKYLPIMGNMLIKAFGTEEQKIELKTKELRSLGMGLPEATYRNIAAARKKLNDRSRINFLPEWMQGLGFIPDMLLHKEITGQSEEKQRMYNEEMMARDRKFSEYNRRREGPEVGDIFGANEALEKLTMIIANAIKTGFKETTVEFPIESGIANLD